MPTLWQWIQIAHLALTLVLAVAVFLFKTGYQVGERRKTVDVGLAEIAKFDAKLAEIKEFVAVRGKELSDKATEIQGYLSNAELFLKELYPALQRSDEKINDMIGDMRERIASCEAIQKQLAEQQAGRWWKETGR